MEQEVLPIGYYCRSARLCLRKAAIARKCQVVAEEIESLRNFKTLVSESILLHPLYSEKKGDRQILELQAHLADAKKRLSELDSDYGKNSANNSSSPLVGFKNGTGKAKSDRPISKMQRPGPSRGSQEIHVPQTTPVKNLQTSPQKLQSKSSPHTPPWRISQEMLGPSGRAQRKGQATPKGTQESAKNLPNSKDQPSSSNDLGVANLPLPGNSSREKFPDFCSTYSKNPSSSSGRWQENMSQFCSKDSGDELLKSKRWDKYSVDSSNSSTDVSTKSKKWDKPSVNRMNLCNDVSLKSKKWEREFSVERSNSSVDESFKLTVDGELDIIESRKHGNFVDMYVEQCSSWPPEDISLEEDVNMPLKVSIVNGECADMGAGIESCIEQNFINSVADRSKCENFVTCSEIGIHKEQFPAEFEGKLKRNEDVIMAIIPETSNLSVQSLRELDADFLEKDNQRKCSLEDIYDSSVGLSKCTGFLTNEESFVKTKFQSFSNHDIENIEEGHGREEPKCRNKPEDWKALFKRQVNLDSVTGWHSTLKVASGPLKNTLEEPDEILDMSKDGSGSSSSESENPIKSAKELVVKQGEWSQHDDRYLSTDSSSSCTSPSWDKPAEVNLSCEKTTKKPWHESTQLCQIQLHADIKNEKNKDIVDYGTPKRAGEMPREQTKGDIEEAGHPKMDGREVSDYMGERNQDALADDTGRLSFNESQIARGEKLVTQPFSLRKKKTSDTSPKKVKFEGLDEIDEINWPNCQELTQLCQMEQHTDTKGQKINAMEKYDLEKDGETSKRAEEMPIEQTKADIEGVEYPKMGGKGISDFMGELTPHTLDDRMGRISFKEKLVTKPFCFRKGNMGAENPKRVKFEGLDEKGEINFSNTKDEVYIDEDMGLVESHDNGMINLDGDDGMTSLNNELDGKLESKSETCHSPKAKFNGIPTLSRQSSASYMSEPSSATLSTSLTLSGNNQELKNLEQEKKYSFPQWPPRSSKMPVSVKVVSHLKTQFYDEERHDMQVCPENAANLEQTTFSNPVFDFESHDNKIFPANDSRLDSSVSLQDDENLTSILHGCARAGSQIYLSGDTKDWASGSEDELEIGKIPMYEVSGNETGDHSEKGQSHGKKLQDRSVRLVGSLQAIIDKKNLQKKLNRSKKLSAQAKHQRSLYLGTTEKQMEPSDSEEEGSLRSSVALKTLSDRAIKQDAFSDQSSTGEDDSSKVETMQRQSVVISPMMLEEALRNHCTSDLDQRIKVANLQDRMGGLQRVVEELKELVESLSVKSKDEDKDEHYTLECLANEIKDLKEGTGHELFEIRKIINNEIKMKLEQIKSDTKLSRDTVQLNISECSAKLEMFQKQVDSEISEAKSISIKNLQEKLAKSVKTVKDGLKNDVEHLEHELLKDMKRFKELIDTELAYLKEDCTTSERNAKQGEAMIEEKFEQWFSNKFNTFWVTKIDVLIEEKLEKWLSNNLGNILTLQADVLTEEKLETWFTDKTGTLFANRDLEEQKKEVCLLKAEVESLSKVREEIHGHVEHVAETTWANFQRDHSFLKSENDSLKKQLEAVRNEGMHMQLIVEDFKKEFNEHINEWRHVLGKMSNNGLQNEIQGLRELEEALELKMVDLSKALVKTEAEVVEQRADFEAFKQVWEGSGSLRIDGTQERTLIMQRVESLSQLFLGGLEEVRTDLLELKVTCSDRFEEQNTKYKELQMKQENQSFNRHLTNELLSDGSENQLAQLKSQEVLDYLEQGRIKVESILAIVTRDKDRAATMAAEVAASADKTEDFLNSVLGSLNNEIVSARWKNTELQENMVIERNAVAAIAFEAKRASEDLHKGKEAAFAAMSETQQTSQKLHEEIEQEWRDLKLTLASVDKEMQLVNTASSRAAAVAMKAEAMLSDITNARMKTMELANGLSETVSKAVECVKEEYIQEAKRVMEALQTTVHVEVPDGKAVKEELEDVKGKTSPTYQVNFEKDEKLVVTSELEHFVRKSELAKSIKEVIGTKDTSSPTRNFLSMEERFATKEEFGQLAKKVEQFIIAIDGINQNNSQFAMGSSSQDSANTEVTVLRPEIVRLERQIRQVSEEQCILGEKVIVIEKKVWKIEDKQTNICDLMEQFQASIIDLETCESPEKEQIQRLYKDVASIAQRLRQVQDEDHTSRLKPFQEGEGITGSQDTKKREPAALSEKRLFTVENRIEHVASAAHTNLCILDAKVERFCIAIQSAVKSAATAESKCNALGAEMVRVFRMLVASSKERPLKLQGYTGHEDSNVAPERHIQRNDSSQAPKGRVPPSQMSGAHPRKAPVRSSNRCTDPARKCHLMEAKSEGQRKTLTTSENLECHNRNVGRSNHQKSAVRVARGLFHTPQGESQTDNSVRNCNKPLESALHQALNMCNSQVFENGDVIDDPSLRGRSHASAPSVTLGRTTYQEVSTKNSVGCVAEQRFADKSLQCEMKEGF